METNWHHASSIRQSRIMNINEDSDIVKPIKGEKQSGDIQSSTTQ